jgi:hypothetical protein
MTRRYQLKFQASLGRMSFLPDPIIGFFNGTFQSHHDQMQHSPVDDVSRERQHRFGMGDTLIYRQRSTR